MSRQMAYKHGGVLHGGIHSTYHTCLLQVNIREEVKGTIAAYESTEERMKQRRNMCQFIVLGGYNESVWLIYSLLSSVRSHLLNLICSSSEILGTQLDIGLE